MGSPLTAEFTKSLLIVLLVATLFGCKKSKNATPAKPAPAPALTAGMGGVRNWHGSHSYYAQGPDFPTTINEHRNYDTSFALTIAGDSSVELFSRVFRYYSTDSLKQIRYFGGGYYYLLVNLGEGVAYFYTKDSLVYGLGDKRTTYNYVELHNSFHTY